MAGELTSERTSSSPPESTRTNTNSDGWIDAAIPAASRSFKEWTGRGSNSSRGPRRHVQRHRRGPRTLPHYPVWSVESVTVDDVAFRSARTRAAAGWVLVDDAVELQGYRFTDGIKNCAIQFTAGYDRRLSPTRMALPEDIDRAVAELVAWKLREKSRVGEQSKTVGNETVVFKLADAPDSVKATVATYRRTGWH
jgi:hypothetical protein